ncbi:MAG: DUF4342 domain-containing protein [Clostridiales bacterium]|nr:DUF4342 domain-containing protein [Clostridiales bacterium]MDY6117187.1 DUF4342 domain-containing protein [Anaerovoracaceae bacterium]
MEITLEKIELVKDRTGVSYREAKDALEKSAGNVVDAIIYIEDSVNGENVNYNEAESKDIISKLKEIVAKGNATKILIKKDDQIVLNIPVNAGIIGSVVAPWGMIAGLVAAFGLRCRIEVVKDDGKSINITDKADKIYDKGTRYYGKASEMFDEAKNRGPEYFDEIKDKTPAISEMYDGLRDFAADIKDKILDRGSDLEVEWEELKDKAAEETEKVKEDADDVVDSAKTKAKDAIDALNDKLDDIEKELDK